MESRPARAAGDPPVPLIRPAVVLVEDRRAMIATRPDTAFSSLRANPAANRPHFARNRSRRDLHDQWQRRASGSCPSSPVERAGAIYQGSLVRESERAGLAGAATAAAG